jgi:RNA polymerase sigma factor for flagellar operon FliA
MIAAERIAALQRHGHGHGDPVAYLPLVRTLARRLGRRLPPYVEVDDLVSAGVVGLMEALQRFDPSRDTAFKSYAEFRIRGAMLDELRRRDMMARDARAEGKRLEQTVADLSTRLGRAPQDHELAEQLGLSVGALQKKLERLVPVRITTLDDDACPTAHQSPFEALDRSQRLSHLTDAVGRLTRRQQQVLHLYYREELTLREIGHVLEVSESRVSQLMSSITLQLRAWMRGRDER